MSEETPKCLMMCNPKKCKELQEALQEQSKQKHSRIKKLLEDNVSDNMCLQNICDEITKWVPKNE